MPHNLKGKVLIVDDDPDDMQALVELLSLEGHMSEPDEKRFSGESSFLS